MKCSEAIELISGRLDGVLSAAEDAALDAHLAQCRECRTIYEELSRLDAALPELDCEPPQALHDGVMREVKKQSRHKKEQRALWRFVASLAAAAAIFVLLAGFGLIDLPGFGEDASVSMIGLSVTRPENEKSPVQQAEEIAAALAEETGCRVLVAADFTPALDKEARELPQGMALYKMRREELDALEKELSGAYDLSVFDAPGASGEEGYLLSVATKSAAK